MFSSLKRYIFVLLCVSLSLSAADRLKILHLTFHRGCALDFQEVGRELDLDVTTWYIMSPDIPRNNLDGVTIGNENFNMTHDRAQCVWDLHKDYFEQFDVIVTSDTAPLSRIFLQNNWKKPLIIWVCNRFDYSDLETSDDTFPDIAYYKMFHAARALPNVRIIAYTAYERLYATRRGIDFGPLLIKPVGLKASPTVPADFVSNVPSSVDKKNTIFLNPRFTQQEQEDYVHHMCNERGIKTYSGVYNGPDDLIGFKGVIYFPYAWSNIALFENLQRGIVHFVPTPQFVLSEFKANKPVRVFTIQDFEYCEWYDPTMRHLFVYFNSWEDLQHKIKTTNYQALSHHVKEYARIHRAEMLARWNGILTDVVDAAAMTS